MTAVAAGDARRRALSIVLAGIAGALFGAGLIVAGLTQPARITGFLNVLGAWDPTLIFVMCSAIPVYGLALRWIQRSRPAPWLDTRFHMPALRHVDRPLLAGSAIFGVGWGLAGLCPAPGIVTAGTGNATGLVFLGAMIAGMWLQHRTAA